MAIFGDSNSLGGHIGVRYQGNKLINLRNAITGRTEGLQAVDNELSGVAADEAKFKSP